MKVQVNSPEVPAKASLRFGLKRRKRQRLIMLIIVLLVLAVATGLVLYGLRGSASFFRMPSEITQEDIQSQRPLRLGGFVGAHSVEKFSDGAVRFLVTDSKKGEPVVFRGLLPDLFREGQGVIVEGRFNSQRFFIAERVLAKHDETYIPKDIADRLKAQGLWEGR